MKRFSFPLEKLLLLRRHERESTEARLAEIQRSRSLARHKAASLERKSFEFREKTADMSIATGAELRAAESYIDHLDKERQSELEAEQKWEREQRTQLGKVVEARRKVRLLETLRSRRLEAYWLGVNREQENEAAELFLAKWVRDRRT